MYDNDEGTVNVERSDKIDSLESLKTDVRDRPLLTLEFLFELFTIRKRFLY